MVVTESVGDLAIVTDGSGGYLVVEILGKAATYAKASKILEEAQEEDDLESDDEPSEDDDEGDEEEEVSGIE